MNNFDFKTSFPPLGHPEHHFNKYPDHPWLKTKNDIERWINENLTQKEIEISGNGRNYQSAELIIDDDLTVSFDISDESNLIHTAYIKNATDFIPVQFKSLDNLVITDIGLKSLIGTPYVAKTVFANNNKIVNWVGLSEGLKRVILDENKIISFEGMPNLNSTSINLIGNAINSWEGFTNCKGLIFWQKEWCESTSKKLIETAPEEVMEITVDYTFKNKEIIIKESSLSIDMEWLRTIQLKNKINMQYDEKGKRKRKV